MTLKLEKPVTPIAPPPAEPLRKASWIAAHVFANEFSARWVMRHCPRRTISRYVVRFLESEVRAWVAGLRKSA